MEEPGWETFVHGGGLIRLLRWGCILLKCGSEGTWIWRLMDKGSRDGGRLTDRMVGERVIYEMFNTGVIVLLGGMHVAWR